MFSPASLFHVFTSFLVFFWRPLGFFWRPFGAFVVSLAFWCHHFGCLWRAWAVCGPSLLLFVVPLARLGCLWARGPLRDCFLLHFRLILVSFFEQFGGGFASFCILVLSGAAFGFCSWCDCLGIFRDGIRWIWERTGRIIEDRQREIRKRREEKGGEPSTAQCAFMAIWLPSRKYSKSK